VLRARAALHAAQVTRVAYRGMAGSNVLLSGARDTSVNMWDFKSTAPVATFKGHEFVVSGLQVLGSALPGFMQMYAN